MLHRTECKTTRIFLGYNHELHDLLGKHQCSAILNLVESRQSWICCLSILDRKASLFLNIILSLHASVILNNMGNRKLHQIPLLLLPVISRALIIHWILHIFWKKHLFFQLCFSSVILLHFFQHLVQLFSQSSLHLHSRHLQGIKLNARVSTFNILFKIYILEILTASFNTIICI